MPVIKDPSGRRYVRAEVEVPGTQEQVWQTIATGPGISSWFVPTNVEERLGGAITANFGPGMDSASTITAWNPPRRFVADSPDMGPNGPTMATEWSVESRSGGTCLVRVVHTWFATTDDWDKVFESNEDGWQAFFRILRLYLTHFRGQPSSAFQLMGVASGATSEAWRILTSSLGLAYPAAGQRVSAPERAPTFAGLIEQVGQPESPELLIRLDEPAPGIAHLFALASGAQIYLPIRVYLYGEQAAGVVAREEPLWQAWIKERFVRRAAG
jgi:uncharacterized protein YndB with AHSA1/START domain